MTDTLTAGTLLAAADALRTRRTDVWTDAEVACLMQMAFRTGQAAQFEGDLAELQVVQLDHATARQTYEQRVSHRVADMEQHAARLAAAMGRPGYRYDGGPVDWHTGQPVRRLEVAA